MTESLGIKFIKYDPFFNRMIDLLLVKESEAKLRDISPDGMGIGLFINEMVEVGELISISIQVNDRVYPLEGQVRWRIGELWLPEGNLPYTHFVPRSEEIVSEEHLGNAYYEEAKGFKYDIGVLLYRPAPPELLAEVSQSQVRNR